MTDGDLVVADEVTRLGDQLITEDGQCLADVAVSLVEAVRGVGHAITPLDASPGTDGHGGRVGSLTEAVMSVAAALHRIADVLGDRTRER